LKIQNFKKMKKKILILLFLLPAFVYSQDLKHWASSNIATWSLIFSAGAFDGFNQSLEFHYDRVDAKLHLYDKFWNPSISWTNKYKNGDPNQGVRFPFSTTALVWTTDGYHLTRFLSHDCIVVGLTVKFWNVKRKWYWYAADIVSYFLVYDLGFNALYEVFTMK